MQREGGLAAEVDTSRLGVGPATRGALEDAAAPQARPSIESQSRNVGKPKVQQDFSLDRFEVPELEHSEVIAFVASLEPEIVEA